MLSGCTGLLGGDGGSDADAEVWHQRTEAEREALEDHVATFEENHDYVIGTEEVSELQDRVETTIPSGDGPELYNWAHDWIGPHAERDFLHDVSGDLSIDIESEYVDTAVDAIQYEGSVYGLPIAGEVPTLMYNKNLIDSPPETLEEMESIMDEFHDPGSSGEYGFAMEFNEYMISFATHAFGGYYFDGSQESDEDQLGLSLEETQRGMEIVRDVLWEYSPNDMAYDPQYQVFQRGNAPLAINGPWGVGDFREAEDVDLGIAPLPTIEGNEPQPYTGVSMYYFSTQNEDEAAREAAIAFAEWESTEQSIIEEMAEEHSYIPVHSDTDVDALPDSIQGFTETFEMGSPTPTAPRMNDVWDPTNQAVEGILTNGDDIATAFEEAEQQILDSWSEE